MKSNMNIQYLNNLPEKMQKNMAYHTAYQLKMVTFKRVPKSAGKDLNSVYAMYYHAMYYHKFVNVCNNRHHNNKMSAT